MTPPDAPRHLRVNGSAQPIDAGPDAPVLSWLPDPAQRAAHLVVHDPAGTLVWDSGLVPTALPEMRFAGPELISRSAYLWRVRIGDADGRLSSWSEESRWETPLLRPEDWSAAWIARRTAPDNRMVRSIVSDHVAWIEPGHWVGQTFSTTGPITTITADLVAELGETVGHLELCTLDGAVLAERRLRAALFPWDRFTHYLEPDPAPPAGDYLLRVRAERGRIGWRSHSRRPDPTTDEISPLPVLGTPLRDGTPEAGVRTIGVETHPAPNPIFRVSFDLPSAPAQARLYAVGLGYGTFHLNGQAVTNAVLDPATTAYDRSILYRSHDVSDLLRPGVNTITAALGRGFHSARGGNTWGWNLAPWHREPVLLAQLEYLDEAGERHVVSSGAGWQAAIGPVVSDLLYTGEHHNPALSADLPWEEAVIVPPPGGVLRPAGLPPIRRFAPVLPVTSVALSESTTVHDFGTVMAGRIRCTLRGQPGAEIIVSYGEDLAADGSVVCDNVLAAGETQVDRYVLASAEATWEPEFSYKGFRYVAIQALGPVTVHEPAAIPVHTDVPEVGEFACGDDLLTWIDTATGRTFRNNLHGIPTDTPVYEKNGWTADAHLATEAVLHHFDLRATFTKWLDDHVDAQKEDGVVPQIVPSPEWGYGPDPAWSASMVLIPWNLYWEYGDRAILERYAEAIFRYTDRMLDIAGDGIWPLHSWGDWLPPGHQFAPEGPMPTATMMLHHLTTRTADICGELGLNTRRSRYEQAAQAIAAAYHEAFFDAATGTYRSPRTGYRQTMNILPLAFGTVPREHLAKVAQGLFDDIELRTGGHLDCGAVGVKYLLPVLSDHGRDDLAITVATQETRPGWGVWRRAGAQTLLESWDETARSKDHYFLGSAAGWIQQRVGGLRATSPGWASFDIRPVVDDRVTWGRISHGTVRGVATVEWARTGDQWDVNLRVPAGATANLILPGDHSRQFGSGSHNS